MYVGDVIQSEDGMCYDRVRNNYNTGLLSNLLIKQDVDRQKDNNNKFKLVVTFF
jgi:hypothetical protein